jgi:hypothetical protein
MIETRGERDQVIQGKQKGGFLPHKLNGLFIPEKLPRGI